MIETAFYLVVGAFIGWVGVVIVFYAIIAVLLILEFTNPPRNER